MRRISQVSSAVKSISGVGDSWCKGSGVGSSWACSGNWKERRLEQTERGGNVVAAMTRVKIGTRSQEASETPENDYGLYFQLTGSHCRVCKQERGCSDVWFLFLKGHVCGCSENSRSGTRVKTGRLREDYYDHPDGRRRGLGTRWWHWSRREGVTLRQQEEVELAGLVIPASRPLAVILCCHQWAPGSPIWFVASPWL